VCSIDTQSYSLNRLVKLNSENERISSRKEKGINLTLPFLFAAKNIKNIDFGGSFKCDLVEQVAEEKPSLKKLKMLKDLGQKSGHG